MYQIFADGNLIYQPANERLRLTSPKLTVEMGKAGSLDFGIPPTNSYYNNLQQLKAILTVVEDGTELFRGRVLSNTRNFNNVRSIYGEGDLSYLIDSVQDPEKFKGKSHDLFRKIIERHNTMMAGSEKVFTIGEITVDNRDVYVAGKSEDITNLETNEFDYNQIVINGEVENWQTTFDYLESSLVDYCGGYLRTRRDNTAGITYIDWLKDYYAVNNQTISFGKNLLDLTEENNAEEAFSVLIPLGDENLTIKDVNNGSNELVSEEALAKYGRIVKTNVFGGVNNASTLLENGRRYLNEHAIPPVTFTVSAVDMHLLNPSVQPIRLGDKVHILSPAHEVDDSDLVCTKIEYDLTNPANTKYTFGKPKQSLTERYRQDKKPDTSGGGGGGGGAAKKAEEASTENQLDFYRAWITKDEEHGKISLNTLFERLYSPAPSPDGVPDTEKAIITSAEILMGSDANGSAVDLISTFNARCDNIANQAGVNVVTGPKGAEVHVFVEDDNTHDRAEINLGSMHEVVEEDENGETHVVYKQESAIALKSDFIEVNAKTFELTTQVATIKASKLFEIESELISLNGAVSVGGTLNVNRYLEAPGIYTNFLFINNRSASLHTHTFTANGGRITIGGADWSGADHSFNIADTKFYKDAIVKAEKNVGIASVRFSGTKTVKALIQLTNGTTESHYYPVPSSGGGGGKTPIPV